MPGLIVHATAMQQCAKLLGGVGVKVSPWGNMGPDIKGPSHGYSFETGTGTILSRIESLAVSLKTCKNVGPVCRDICHLCTDSFRVGQISSELWGKYDDRIDFMGEFVLHKKKYTPRAVRYLDKDLLISDHMATMKGIYKAFKTPAKELKFLWSKKLAILVRYEVRNGAEFAFSWIDWGIRQ